jgi:hypothetical protein
MAVPVAWVASLLAVLQPSAPWSSTYERTAEAIAHASESDPLFPVEDRGEARTAALLVAVAWHESRFKPDAVSANRRGLCLYQLDRSFFDEPKKALSDPDLCARTAIKILRRSLEACRGRAPNERLAVFVSGTCDRGGPESRYRMSLAQRLLREHPMPPPAAVQTAPPPFEETFEPTTSTGPLVGRRGA